MNARTRMDSDPLPLSRDIETADIETASDDYATRFSGDIGDYFLAVQTEITLRLLKSFPMASVLDIGGGHAQLAVPLVRNGYDVTVTGSDNICRKRLDMLLPKGSFSYQTCDCLQLPYKNGQFDVVIAFRLLPHARQWKKLIREMCRVAKKAVILDYPDKRSANIFYNFFFDLKRRAEGNTRTYYMFSRRLLNNEFEKNNFDRTSFNPEFFFPMVIHRKLKRPKLSKRIELYSRAIGLTKLLGSPIILCCYNQEHRQ